LSSKPLPPKPPFKAKKRKAETKKDRGKERKELERSEGVIVFSPVASNPHPCPDNPSFDIAFDDDSRDAMLDAESFGTYIYVRYERMAQGCKGRNPGSLNLPREFALEGYRRDILPNSRG
jgi:hypothetical protein